MSNILEDQYIDIELTLNDIEAEYRVYFDWHSVQGEASTHTGTSRQEGEDYPDVTEYHDFQIENIDGSFSPLPSELDDTVIEAISEQVELMPPYEPEPEYQGEQ